MKVYYLTLLKKKVNKSGILSKITGRNPKYF